MLIIILLVLSCFIGAYSQDPSFQDTSEILEKFLLEAIKNNKTIDIDFGDSDEKPCIPLEAVSESTPVAGRRISEQKCYEYIEQMKNREKEEKWAERCRLYLLSQIKKGVFDEIIFVINSPVIFGGRPAINGEFPHMGAIGWRSKDSSKKWVFKCGGALISEKFVLTAAHCSKLSLRRVSDIVNRQPEIVRLGVNDITSDEFEINGQITDVKIKRIIVHPKYASPKKYYDIALIELEQEVKFIGNLQPACLWINNDFSELGNTASVTGWGYTEDGHQSEVLRTATIPVIETKQCEPLLVQHRNRNWKGLTNHQICAGNLTGGVDTCQGDSGGPLQIKMPLKTEGNMHWILGVTSFGIKCGRKNRPGVYTRVSSFIDWIEENVWAQKEIPKLLFKT